MAGKEWIDHRIVGCDPEALKNTLPKGLKGVPVDCLAEASTELRILVPELPHPLHQKFTLWRKEQGIEDIFVYTVV